MRKILCFNERVGEKKDVVVGMKVGESVKRQLDKIAEEQDRTISYISRELMLRGLALYEQDGMLKDGITIAKGIADARTARHVGDDVDLERRLRTTGVAVAPTAPGSSIKTEKEHTKDKRRVSR